MVNVLWFGKEYYREEGWLIGERSGVGGELNFFFFFEARAPKNSGLSCYFINNEKESLKSPSSMMDKEKRGEYVPDLHKITAKVNTKLWQWALYTSPQKLNKAYQLETTNENKHTKLNCYIFQHSFFWVLFVFQK